MDKQRFYEACDRYERIPTDITDEICINGVRDYGKLIPVDLPEIFTAMDYKKAAGVDIHTARTALNILNHVGAVERTGKKGNTFIYKKSYSDI